MAPKRKSHTADFKLQVIKRAKEIGNCAVGREFLVGETSVREWRKSEQELEKMNPRKTDT
jgi:transposase-like protein